MARDSACCRGSARRARAVLGFSALLGLVVFASPTAAQDLDSADSLADDEWLSDIDRSWDPEYSQQWYRLWGPAETERWSLSVSAGAAEGRVRRWGWGGAEQLAQVTDRRNIDQREIYALALLELPMVSWGSARRTPRVLSSDQEQAQVRLSLLEEREAGGENRPRDETPVEHHAKARHVDPPASLDRFGKKNTDSDKAAPPQERANIQLLQLTRQLEERIRRGPHTLAGLSRLRSLERRSRHSGLVPELRLRGVLGVDQTTSSQDVGAVVPGETTLRGARDSLIEARLTFRLDHLVYGASEAALDRRRAQLLEQMRDEQKNAIARLIDWTRATRKMNDPGLLPEEMLEAADEQRAALLELNFLTDGWFEGSGTLRELGLLDLLHSLRGAQQDEGEEQLHGPDSRGQRLR